MTRPTPAEHAELQRAHHELVAAHRQLERKMPCDLSEHAAHVEALRRHIERLRQYRARLPEHHPAKTF